MPLSRNLGTLTSWNPLGHSGPVTGLIFYIIHQEEWLCVVDEKDASFGSYTSLYNELATHGISSVGGLCDEHEGGSSSREEEEGGEHDCQPLRGFAEVRAINRTLKAFFYVHSICGCNEQNILNFELVVSFEM